MRQLLDNHPRIRTDLPTLMGEGIEITEDSDGKVYFWSKDKRVQLAMMQYIARKPQGYRMRAYKGKSQLEIVVKTAATPSDVNHMVQKLVSLLVYGVEAKTKKESAAAWKQTMANRE